MSEQIYTEKFSNFSLSFGNTPSCVARAMGFSCILFKINGIWVKPDQVTNPPRDIKIHALNTANRTYDESNEAEFYLLGKRCIAKNEAPSPVFKTLLDRNGNISNLSLATLFKDTAILNNTRNFGICISSVAIGEVYKINFELGLEVEAVAWLPFIYYQTMLQSYMSVTYFKLEIGDFTKEWTYDQIKLNVAENGFIGSLEEQRDFKGIYNEVKEANEELAQELAEQERLRQEQKEREQRELQSLSDFEKRLYKAINENSYWLEQVKITLLTTEHLYLSFKKLEKHYNEDLEVHKNYLNQSKSYLEEVKTNTAENLEKLKQAQELFKEQELRLNDLKSDFENKVNEKEANLNELEKDLKELCEETNAKSDEILLFRQEILDNIQFLSELLQKIESLKNASDEASNLIENLENLLNQKSDVDESILNAQNLKNELNEKIAKITEFNENFEALTQESEGTMRIPEDLNEAKQNLEILNEALKSLTQSGDLSDLKDKLTSLKDNLMQKIQTLENHSETLQNHSEDLANIKENIKQVDILNEALKALSTSEDLSTLKEDLTNFKNESQNAIKLIKDNVELSVGSGGKFSDLNDALNEALYLRRNVVNGSKGIKIILKDGYIIDKRYNILEVDLRGVTLTSERDDKIVESTFNLNNGDKGVAICFYFRNANSFIWDIILQAQNYHHSRAIEGANSRFWINSGRGVDGFFEGLSINNGSNIYAVGLVATNCGKGTKKLSAGDYALYFSNGVSGIVTGANFSGTQINVSGRIGGCGIYCGYASKLALSGANLTKTKNFNFHIYQGSATTVFGANLTGATWDSGRHLRTIYGGGICVADNVASVPGGGAVNEVAVNTFTRKGIIII